MTKLIAIEGNLHDLLKILANKAFQAGTDIEKLIKNHGYDTEEEKVQNLA